MLLFLLEIKSLPAVNTKGLGGNCGTEDYPRGSKFCVLCIKDSRIGGKTGEQKKFSSPPVPSPGAERFEVSLGRSVSGRK